LVNIYLQKADMSYSMQNINMGDEALQKIELLLNQYPTITIQQNYIGDLYAKPAAYYFKMNNIKKAREYINRGLKYAPENYRLKNSLKMLR